MTVQEAITMLETHGWRVCRVVGVLRHFRHADQPGIVTLTGKLEFEVPRGALKSLRRYALKEEDG